MFKFIVRVLAIIGFLVVVLGIGIALWINSLKVGLKSMPSTMVLEYKLETAPPEQGSGEPITASIFGYEPSMREVVSSIQEAAADPRVKAFVVHAGSPRLGMAQAQELRDAVNNFRKSGKKAVFYAETLGEFMPIYQLYYLATAFDEIWIQPMGLVGLTKPVMEMPFARGALNKMGIELQLGKRKEFKSVADTLTENGLTQANREQLQAVLTDITEQLRDGIAEGRELPASQVSLLLNKGPFIAKEAVGLHLIDKVGYYEQAIETAVGKEAKAPTVDIVDYIGSSQGSKWTTEANRMAVVTVEGMIVRGDTRGNGPEFADGGVIEAVKLASTLEEIAEDKTIKAVIMRINSPGGSAFASEQIRHAMERVIKAGKPVVVSMGDAAASGGYWIAMSSSAIVAQPGTITGSIGVIAGKPVTQEMWKKLGINWERIGDADNASMWSLIRGYNQFERERLETVLDDIYDNFLEGVSKGRKLPMGSVKAIARGRVWTGKQALELKLVDRLGGFDTAVEEAKKLANIPDKAKVEIVVYPKDGGFFGQILRSVRGFGLMTNALSWASTLSQPLSKVMGMYYILQGGPKIIAPELVVGNNG